VHDLLIARLSWRVGFEAKAVRLPPGPCHPNGPIDWPS